jgi:plasmid stability protein
MNALIALLRGDSMAMLTVRNLPDDVHRALRVQAAQHGRSTEAEVRAILALAVKPEVRVRLGEALAALGRKVGLTNDDVEVLAQVRDKTPAEPLRFG